MKRRLSLILAIALILTLFAGCGGKSETSAKPSETAEATSGATSAPTAGPTAAATPAQTDSPYHFAAGNFETDAEGWPLAKYEYELPLTTQEETFSLMTCSYVPQYIPEEGMIGIPIWSNMAEMTGVNIEYNITTIVDTAERFAILLAADDLPDICSQGQNRYNGTQQEAISDGWFVNIADYREYIPNYLYEIRERSKANPNIYEKVFLDDETACVFYTMSKIQTGIGWFIREDLMEELGLGKAKDITTLDQLHEVFKAFKVSYGDEGFWPMILYYCFELGGGKLLSCYNTTLFTFAIGYFKRIGNGQGEFCGAPDDDLAAITTLNEWWNEGLIDPNWSSYTGNPDLGSQFANGTMGYVFLTPDDSVVRNAECVDPDCKYMPTPRMRLTEDQVLKWGLAPNSLGDGSYVVSADCANIPLCLTWIDWQYSEDGSEYISWGPEGDLWNYNENGERMLSDFILNHDAGSTWIMQLYGASTISDGGLVDNSRNYAIPGGKELLEMLEVWDVSGYYDGEYDWHDGIRLTEDQNSEVGRLSGDINTYYAENYSLFLIGERPLNEWDSYIQTLMDIGLERTYEIYNDAYQAYLGA